MANLKGSTSEANVAGVFGESTNQGDTAGVGVHGISRATGVIGESGTWHGVVGFSRSTTGGFGVYGEGLAGGPGVGGVSKTWHVHRGRPVPVSYVKSKPVSRHQS